MEDIIIHKVAFAEEAVFDYEHCLVESANDLPLVRFPKGKIKEELEDYIHYHNHDKNKHYFRVRYHDQTLDQELMLFIRKGSKMSIMQNWTVIGICLASDWCEEMEEEGVYKDWYDTKITNLDNDDWVEALRVKAEIEKLTLELEEIKDTEYERRKQQEHDRRFGKKGAKRVHTQQKQTARNRERLKTELRILTERLRTAEGKTGIY